MVKIHAGQVQSGFCNHPCSWFFHYIQSQHYLICWRRRHHQMIQFFQIQTRRGITPLTDSVARKHLKQVSISLTLLKSSLFMISGELGPLGLSGLASQFRIYKLKVPGHWTVHGATFRFLRLFHLKWLLPSAHIFLHDAFTPTPYLGLGGFSYPSLCYSNHIAYKIILHCFNLFVHIFYSVTVATS